MKVGLAGRFLALPVSAPTRKLLIPRALLPQRGLAETVSGQGCESRCLIQSP